MRIDLAIEVLKKDENRMTLFRKVKSIFLLYYIVSRRWTSFLRGVIHISKHRWDSALLLFLPDKIQKISLSQ